MRTITNPASGSSKSSAILRTEFQALETEIANTTSGHDHDGTDSKSIPAASLPSSIDATKIADGSVSNTEFQYVNGVTSAIQTQINTKAPTASPTFTGTVTIPTPFTLGAVSVTPTGTELNFVDGVTSAIQTQLDAKVPITKVAVSTALMTEVAVGFTLEGGTTKKTLTVPLDASVSGTNTGDNAANTSIVATKLDDFTAPDDNTDLNASTTAHGLLIKATAPAAGLTNVVAIENGETVYKNKALFDATDPTTQAFGDAAAVGTAVVAARGDHKHAMMAAPTTVSGNAGSATVLQTARAINGINFDGSAAITVGPDLTGWIPTTATLTYSSTDAPNYVVTTSVDLTGSIGVGMRIKLTHAAAVKYFIVQAIDATTMTLYGGTDYTLADTTITLPYYSPVKIPLGFPLDPTKWTVTTTDTGNRSQASPVDGTVYNIQSLTIIIPIGSWNVDFDCVIEGYKAGGTNQDLYAGLSTANNSLSDAVLKSNIYSAETDFMTKMAAGKQLVLASKTTYYLNEMSAAGSLDSINVRGDRKTTVIRAVSAYL